MIKLPTFLMCLAALASTLELRAEGTKQLSPTAADTTVLIVNEGIYGSFAAPGGPSDSRMLLHLADPQNEQVFFGFSEGFADRADLDGPSNHARRIFRFRVLAPDGTVVKDWQEVNGTNSNLNTFAQVTAGPAALNPSDPNGYPTAAGFTFVPGTGITTAGDYVIEITGRDGTADVSAFIPRFDVTVATRGASPQELPGRLYSLNWAICAPWTAAYRANNAQQYTLFDRPFKGVFYVYSAEGFVSKVDFANAGFQPLSFNISFNSTGTANTGDLLGDARSVEAFQTNPEYKIFLQEPPAAHYPSGSFGKMLVTADYPRLYGCAASGEYYVEVATNSAGQIEVFVDGNGNDRYDDNSADRILSMAVTPAPGEAAPYIRRVPWDGKDGVGATIADAASVSATVTFSQIPYHLPIYDAEYMLQGFEVEIVRPFSPAEYTIKYQWDDRNITEAAPAGAVKVQLQGDQTTLHRWDNADYGNNNTVNTYWYARREPSAVTLSRADPDIGCASGAQLLISGNVFDDADGSKRRGATEAGITPVTAQLYRDTDGDGVRDAGEPLVQTAPTDANGDFVFDLGTPTQTPVTSSTATAPADAIQLTTNYYDQFFAFGGFTNATGNFPLTTSVYFTGASVPAGAEIVSAAIALKGAAGVNGDNTGGNASVQFYGELAANPAITSVTSLPAARPKTSASVQWDITSAPVVGTDYSTPDLSAVLQEVVDGPGYAASDALHLIAEGTGQWNAFQQAGVTGETAPRLEITYRLHPSGRDYTVVLAPASPGLANRVYTTDETRAVSFGAGAPKGGNDFGLARDRDGDGVVDGVDLDNDNDGIADAQEDGGTGFSPTGDADGDGVLNFADDSDNTTGFIAWVDANNDGVHDRYDADGDGVPDVYDLDADNDGITDLVEAGGTDADGDGRVDAATDTDGDGLADVYDNNDTDGPLGNGLDGTTPSSSVLTDRNADGTTDGADADDDGKPNYVDLDADNDGLTDATEAGLTDANNDGRVDDATDTDGDGLADAIDPSHDGPLAATTTAPTAGTPTALADVDRDGKPAPYDLDADGDGLADVVEAGATDADGDGRVDFTADADGDGLADRYDTNHAGPLATAGNAPTAGTDLGPGADTDGDGIADRLDLDADNDGIADVIEAGAADADGDGRADQTADADADGLADVYDAAHDGPDAAIATAPTTPGTAAATTAADSGDGTPTGPAPADDLDGDGVFDFRDLDTDNDGIPDLVEAMGADADGDGRVDDATDADQDGLADVVDGDNDATPAPADGNGALVKTDAAGAVVDTRTAQGSDFDGDGHANWRDRDSDNDGIADLTEAGAPLTADANADGRLDPSFATDADGDGLADAYDADANDGPAAPTGSTNANGTPLVLTLADANADGSVVAEGFAAGSTGTDADGRPDYRDLDSDDDGLTDNVEQNGGSVANDLAAGQLDGMVPVGAGDYAINNTNVPLDSDGDGLPDYRDLDADNDGILDNHEAVCTGCPSAGGFSGSDTNANGVDDAFEGLDAANANGGGNVGATPNELAADADATPDYLDFDSDGDGAADFSEGFDDDKDGYALDDLLARADAYEANSAAAVHYDNDADADADGLPDWLDGLATAGNDETVRPPFLNPASAFWLDADANGVADLFDAARGGTPSAMPDRDGANDRDWRDVSTGAPVPVELIHFAVAARDCDLAAAWTVGTEEAVSHYVLEASTDGVTFAPVAETLATGATDYRATVAAAADVTYLRLRTVDLDGGASIGDVVGVRSACPRAGDLVIAPNPVTPGATLSVTAPQAGALYLVDATGRIAFATRASAGEAVEIPTAGLAAGVYVVRAAGRTQKLVVR